MCETQGQDEEEGDQEDLEFLPPLSDYVNDIVIYIAGYIDRIMKKKIIFKSRGGSFASTVRYIQGEYKKYKTLIQRTYNIKFFFVLRFAKKPKVRFVVQIWTKKTFMLS